MGEVSEVKVSVSDGAGVGLGVGFGVGLAVGVGVGSGVGSGVAVGAISGVDVGAAVGASVANGPSVAVPGDEFEGPRIDVELLDALGWAFGDPQAMVPTSAINTASAIATR